MDILAQKSATSNSLDRSAIKTEKIQNAAQNVKKAKSWLTLFFELFNNTKKPKKRVAGIARRGNNRCRGNID